MQIYASDFSGGLGRGGLLVAMVVVAAVLGLASTAVWSAVRGNWRCLCWAPVAAILWFALLWVLVTLTAPAGFEWTSAFAYVW